MLEVPFEEAAEYMTRHNYAQFITLILSGHLRHNSGCSMGGDCSRCAIRSLFPDEVYEKIKTMWEKKTPKEQKILVVESFKGIRRLNILIGAKGN